MDFDEEFDNKFDEDLDELFDEDLDEDLEGNLDDSSKNEKERNLREKTPTTEPKPKGKRIAVYFISTVGPGEKKQKLIVNTGYKVGDIKETAANLFGLDPADFHLSSFGITLEENLSLSEYHVSDGDDILLIPASTAG